MKVKEIPKVGILDIFSFKTSLANKTVTRPKPEEMTTAILTLSKAYAETKQK